MYAINVSFFFYIFYRRATPFIRVYDSDPKLILKALGISAYGIWVPHIASREECERAVKAIRHPPHGIRGVCPVVRAFGCVMESAEAWDKYLRLANEEVMVTVLPLESKKGIDNIEESPF